MEKLKRAKLKNVMEEDEDERGTKRGYRMRLNEALIDDRVGLTLSWPSKCTHTHTHTHTHSVSRNYT